MSMSCDSFRFHKCTTQQNHQSKIFLFLLVLIGWLTRFRKSQGYTHFKIYQFESSRLECFVEGKIPVDRHLRFHCFRPFSSDYEARKLIFFESCKTGLNFAEVDKKSAKKKIFFCLQLKSSVTACFFLMMSQWECRTWHCCYSPNK